MAMNMYVGLIGAAVILVIGILTLNAGVILGAIALATLSGGLIWASRRGFLDF